MNREVHVRFCERPGVRFPRPTRRAGARDGRRRMRYGDALGSAMETQAGIEAAVAIGYLDAMPEKLSGRFGHIIGVLTKVS